MLRRYTQTRCQPRSRGCSGHRCCEFFSFFPFFALLFLFNEDLPVVGLQFNIPVGTEQLGWFLGEWPKKNGHTWMRTCHAAGY